MTKYFKLKLNTNQEWEAHEQTESYSYKKITNGTFSSLKDAEAFVNAHFVPKTPYDRPWIDHEINGFTGHLMTFEQWKEDCDFGGFIDYDGDGYLLNNKFETVDFVVPSDYTAKRKLFHKEGTYVLWFNK